MAACPDILNTIHILWSCKRSLSAYMSVNGGNWGDSRFFRDSKKWDIYMKLWPISRVMTEEWSGSGANTQGVPLERDRPFQWPLCLLHAFCSSASPTTSFQILFFVTEVSTRVFLWTISVPQDNLHCLSIIHGNLEKINSRNVIEVKWQGKPDNLI